MHLKVDRGTDTIHLDLTDAAVADSREVAAGIVVDYDADGFIVGLAIRDASRRAGDRSTMRHVSFDAHGPL